MHLEKPGIRILGIAESYHQRESSLICGVVMRRDLIIDGCAFSRATVGGTDATDAVLTIWDALGRHDINAILLSGCIISWFNIIDPEQIRKRTGIPVIGVSYEESEGLEGDIRHHFPGDEERLGRYNNLGRRIAYPLSTGKTIYLRAWGTDHESAGRLCNIFTQQGHVPEPVKVARLMARGADRFLRSG